MLVDFEVLLGAAAYMQKVMTITKLVPHQINASPAQLLVWVRFKSQLAMHN